jgi:hypothetical protein
MGPLEKNSVEQHEQAEVLAGLESAGADADSTRLIAGVDEALSVVFDTFKHNIEYTADGGPGETLADILNPEARLEKFFATTGRHIKSFVMSKIEAKFLDKEKGEALDVANWLFTGSPPPLYYLMINEPLTPSDNNTQILASAGNNNLNEISPVDIEEEVEEEEESIESVVVETAPPKKSTPTPTPTPMKTRSRKNRRGLVKMGNVKIENPNNEEAIPPPSPIVAQKVEPKPKIQVEENPVLDIIDEPAKNLSEALYTKVPEADRAPTITADKGKSLKLNPAAIAMLNKYSLKGDKSVLDRYGIPGTKFVIWSPVCAPCKSLINTFVSGNHENTYFIMDTKNIRKETDSALRITHSYLENKVKENNAYVWDEERPKDNSIGIQTLAYPSVITFKKKVNGETWPHWESGSNI